MNQSESEVQIQENNSVSKNVSKVIENKQNNLESFESLVENTVTTHQENSYIGQVKWFNNRLGYGFITIMTPGNHIGEDIFVHQQHINPKKSEYRSLQQGEYVSFFLGAADSESELQKNGHPHQAVSVTGIYGGSLLCDQIPRREQTNNNVPNHPNNRINHKQLNPTTAKDTSKDTSNKNINLSNKPVSKVMSKPVKNDKKEGNGEWKKVVSRKQK